MAENLIPVVNYKFTDKEGYQKFLNLAPMQEWVESRTLGGSKTSLFVPAHIAEGIADQIFLYWDLVDEKYSVVANEILCTVKIEYQPSYPGSDIRRCTGTAAKPIQMSSKSDPALFPKNKILNSLEYCAPSSQTAAIANAFKHLGNVFGRNLNRATVNNFTVAKKEESKK